MGWFPFTYLLFYTLAGLFTCVFHATYLAFGRPSQAIAGLAAIGVSLALTALIVVVAILST